MVSAGFVKCLKHLFNLLIIVNFNVQYTIDGKQLY